MVGYPEVDTWPNSRHLGQVPHAAVCKRVLFDLSPTESWGDSSQNGFQNVRIVGDTELIWNGQQ